MTCKKSVVPILIFFYTIPLFGQEYGVATINDPKGFVIVHTGPGKHFNVVDTLYITATFLISHYYINLNGQELMLIEKLE